MSPTGMSHHQVLVLRSKYVCYTPQKHTAKEERFNFTRGDYGRLGEHNWEEEIKDMDVAEAWSYLEASLDKDTKETLPVKKWFPNVKGKKPLWMNASALKKARVKRKAYQRYLPDQGRARLTGICKGL